ncbi:MAG: pyridoxamine 5'-phosphate oxidase family protein [Pseudomonadota bacterium]
MGKSFSEISADHRAFIHAQKMFFVATADTKGRINISPKGLDALRVMDAGRVVWLNLTGSGNETGAHVLYNPRMTLMFCAFEGDPQVLRLYGQARIIHEGDEDWPELYDAFPDYAGGRQIFDVRIDLVHQSCGMGVPLMTYQQSRAESQLEPFFARMGPAGTKAYQQRKNRRSLDGKPTDIRPTGD